MPNFELIEGYRPGVLGRIAEMHGIFYAKTWGSGEKFEGMMACELHDFFEQYQVGRDLMVTAWVNGRIVGSAGIDGSEGEEKGARLRWVLVEESFHGQGIGKSLFKRTQDFCRENGFKKIYLWTAEGLPQSLDMYLKEGFVVVERIPDTRHSVPLVNLRLVRNVTP